MHLLTSLPLGDDIIDRILTFLPDFHALQATILSCKAIHNVFKLRPQSIVRAIAYNLAGPALPQALGVVRSPSSDSDSESDVPNSGNDLGQDSAINASKWTEVDPISPISSGEAKMLASLAGVAKGLEAVFSQWHKVRSSRSSRLNSMESWRFRRAIYRLMLYAQAFPPEKLEELVFLDDDVHDEEVQKVRLAQQAFLAEFPTYELVQMNSVCEFLKELITWIEIADGDREYYENFVELVLPHGPAAIWNAYVEDDVSHISIILDDLDDSLFQYFQGYLSRPLEAICEERKVKLPATHSEHWKLILETIEGENDTCKRCSTPCGLKLWNESNWSTVKGNESLAPHKFPSYLKGKLPMNVIEFRAVMMWTSGSSFVYHDFMTEIHGMRTSQWRSWNKDDWLCEKCIGELLSDHLMLWMLERHKKDGDTINEDCWYGYNCRTQTHSHHASRLNHLCEPSPVYNRCY